MRGLRFYCFKDAQKFARRSRRKNIVSSDIDFALKNRLIEVFVLFFFLFNFWFLILTIFSFQPIYGFYSNDQIPFRATTSTGGNASGRCIYYVEDQVVDLNEIISVNNSSVKIPNDLVINGMFSYSTLILNISLAYNQNKNKIKSSLVGYWGSSTSSAGESFIGESRDSKERDKRRRIGKTKQNKTKLISKNFKPFFFI